MEQEAISREAVGALLILFLAVRIKEEEEMLVARFGEEYTNYMKTTGRLLPKL
jgi:protein-S-isoprenylcysteine O-methyltransferase Ste14